MSLDIQDSVKQVVLEGLNDRQLEAVQAGDGETLVIAGAGSGKTSVLTRRVAYLITQGEIPGQILCMTFTNKAAKEMNQRVRDLLLKVGIDLPYNPIWKTDYQNSPLLCTFHSLGVRILREFGDRIDLSREFSIIDTSDQKKIIKELLKERNIDAKNVPPGFVINFISKCKQELLTASKSKSLTQDYLPIFHQLYKAYEDYLKASSSVDFDDLLLLTYLIISGDLEVRQILQKRWKHILIDEFQDTNQAQFEIVKLLYEEI